MQGYQSINQKQKKNVKLLFGRWNKAEKQRFLKGLQVYGRDWIRVQKIVKTRTLSQIRSHAQKVFLKMSQNDIDSIFPQSLHPQPQNSLKPLPSSPKIKSKQHLPVSIYQIPKLHIKPQINLVEIFMKAIQQFQHTNIQEIQNLQKDQQTKIRPDDLNRLHWKSQKVFQEKDNSEQNQTLFKTMQSRSDINSIENITLENNLNHEVKHS